MTGMADQVKKSGTYDATHITVLEGIEAVRDSLRPAPIVLHLDGLRVKVPFEEYGDQIAELEIYGRKLGDIARITGSRMKGSTLIRIMTECEVKARDALKQ